MLLFIKLTQNLGKIKSDNKFVLIVDVVKIRRRRRRERECAFDLSWHLKREMMVKLSKPHSV